MLIGFLWVNALKLRSDWMVYAKLFKLRVDTKQCFAFYLLFFQMAWQENMVCFTLNLLTTVFLVSTYIHTPGPNHPSNRSSEARGVSWEEFFLALVESNMAAKLFRENPPSDKINQFFCRTRISKR